MLDGLPVPAAVLALLAALIHVYIFALESLLWATPRARRTFGLTPEQAATTRELAYNQGWYNLFLAIGTVVGIVLARAGADPTRAAGVGVLLLATGSMVAAAVVLVLRSPRLVRAAAVQGLAPLAAIAFVLLA